MPMGHKLTEQEVDAIGRWAKQELDSGRYIPRATIIADRLGITRQAVIAQVWQSAAKLCEITRWKDPDDLS